MVATIGDKPRIERRGRFGFIIAARTTRKAAWVLGKAQSPCQVIAGLQTSTDASPGISDLGRLPARVQPQPAKPQ